jgi:hypothetical protein
MASFSTALLDDQDFGRISRMTTLAVVEEILRETAVPMSVREIVEKAGVRLPSKSKTPDTVVARDLSMDLKKKGDGSIFARTSPGRYTLKELASASASVSAPATLPSAPRQPIAAPTPMASALSTRKPAVSAPTSSASASPARERRGSEADGGAIG